MKLYWLLFFIFFLSINCNQNHSSNDNFDKSQKKTGDNIPNKNDLTIETIPNISNQKADEISHLNQRDTINIEQRDYDQKIIFSKEMLFDHCRPVNIECSIDAKEFLAYLDLGVGKIYSESLIKEKVFTKAELTGHLDQLKKYIKKELKLSGKLILRCPDASNRTRIRNLLKDMNHGIYYLFRWQYFSDNMKLGKVQFYHKNQDQYSQLIFTEEVQKQNRKIIKYFLDIDNQRIYSENLELK